ncbi:MAG: hypothetical protein A2X86_15560 [Bdellovibrionales bacterium GWA2_49_15]|nr:MAG: hypothetical protein A2X86_15560 [Bdellovibrionales bacterium GWA2_49_15]HAZ14547.1 phage adsorption protein NrfB [Bdellovibrionales bacterium]
MLSVILSTIFERLDILVSVLFLPQMVIFFVLGMEGVIIDLIYWFKRLGPLVLTPAQFALWKKLPQKRMAIMVACWHEEDVIEAMVTGNLSNVEYKNYDFFLGVYPNDTGTLEIVQRLAATYPNVNCVVNALSGPTCKGQMINEMVKEICRRNDAGNAYDVVMYHDSEDAIHPLSLYAVNKILETKDFVQIPVFSFPLPMSKLVGGTYMDEFAESHLKELLVREACGSSIPSAGVGTAFTMKFLKAFREQHDGQLFNPKSLTEDYELGIRCHRMKFGQTLASICIQDGKRREYISTREFFPQEFAAAVRQKSRWNLGIIFQGYLNLGWDKNFIDNYFLYRDRIGLISTPLAFWSGVLFIYALLRHLVGVDFLNIAIARGVFPASMSNLLWFVLLTNMLFMMNRILHRAYFCTTLYGLKHGLMSPVRLVVGNVVNYLALYKGTKQFITSKLTGQAPKWLKTAHVAPIMASSTPLYTPAPQLSDGVAK